VRTAEVTGALLRGDQKAVDRYTQVFLSSKVMLPRRVLLDERKAPASVVVTNDRGEVRTYGVDTVSNYFLCLLHVRHSATTRELIPAEVAGACVHEDDCEPCNSIVRPVPVAVEMALRDAWLRKPELFEGP